MWSVWRNITKNTNGKTINQFNVKDVWDCFFPETMSYQYLGTDRKQEFIYSVFASISNGLVGGRLNLYGSFVRGSKTAR